LPNLAGGAHVNRAAKLEHVRQIRDGVLPSRDLPFGRVVLRIPVEDMPILRRLYPDLVSRDPLERTRAWQRFARSHASFPYRTARKVIR